jgi:hypothetical protein
MAQRPLQFFPNLCAECRECPKRSDSPIESAQTSAKIERRTTHEIHFDDELPEDGLRHLWRLAEEGHPGAHRVHARSQQGSPRIRRIGVRRRFSRPKQAKIVRAGKDGAPVTDGVFPEAKEFLAGYWIVDVEGPEQAYAVAARASAAPGPGGSPMNMPIEVRQVMSGPPDEFV